MLIWEASAVAQAAVEEGVAAVSSEDLIWKPTEKNSKQDLGYLVSSCEVCLIKSRDEINGLFSQKAIPKKIKAAAQLVDLKYVNRFYLVRNQRFENHEGVRIRF